MPPTSVPTNTGQDRRKIASRKVVGVGGPAAADDCLAVWAARYLELAVRGARSAEVAAKIARHLDRFRTWFAAGFGHDRITAVTAREIAGWREHLAATVVAPFATAAPRRWRRPPSTTTSRTCRRSSPGPPARPTGLLPHGDPTARVELLRLPAPEPRALSAAQVRTVKNVLDRLEGFHQLRGRRHQRGDPSVAVHAHARPLRDRAIVHGEPSWVGTLLANSDCW